MQHTQVELISPEGTKEVWWLPVPEGKAHIGERITRDCIDNANNSEDWHITQVCVTIPEEAIPLGSRIASNFRREAEVIAFMSI